MQKYTGRILDYKKLTNDVIYLKIIHTGPTVMHFEAGQYFTVFIKKGVLRAYSIATDEREDSYIETYIDISPGGPGSIFFNKMSERRELLYTGPSGHFLFEENKEKTIFISTGTGVVPFLSMIKKGLHRGKQSMYLLQGLRYEKDEFLKSELDLLSDSRCFSYDITFSRDKSPGSLHGRVTDHIDKIIEKNGKDIQVYICGARNMIKDVESSLISHGIDQINIKYEKYN